jgi:hypothetical protein
MQRTLSPARRALSTTSQAYGDATARMESDSRVMIDQHIGSRY